LVRVLAFEEPERAVIFCNTREETGRVAEYLRRQGMHAEPISSDLSQSEREDVMQRMRAGNIRFLVATDVAARGIDIENLPCVINYTFPESPELYIHRTGRTGRAGKSGHAVSLIGPTEVGSFYYLKLLYKIRPEERSLPSEAEVRSRREGEKLSQLRALLPGDPSAEWHSLARRLMGAVDAERLLGSLLRGALSSVKPEAHHAAPVVVAAHAPEGPAPIPEAPFREERRPRTTHDEHRPSAYGQRERPERERGPRERPGRERSRSDRPADSGPSTRPAGSASPQPTRKDDGREFWEVWSEEVGRTPGNEPAPRTEAAAPAAMPTTIPAAEGQPSSDKARLYVNLGRKDGVTPENVAELLSSSGVSVPTADVELMNTHSYVNVSRDDAEKLCKAMVGKEYNGRAVTCEPARPPRRRF
jgi:superfamily II DNA/RNA helicase